MLGRLNIICLVFSLWLWSGQSGAADGPKKSPIPEPAALKTPTTQVADTFKNDLIAAKTAEQKSTLARRILEVACSEHNAANQYCLFTKARDIASDVGDYECVLNAIEGLDQLFIIDSLKMKTDAAAIASKAIHTTEDQQIFGTQLVAVLNQTLTADRYDLARSLANTCLVLARSSNDADRIHQATSMLTRVRDTEKAFHEVQKYASILAGKPTDPKANLEFGKFYAFLKDDWGKGLPMLVLGDDPILKDLAQKEIADPKDISTQVALGDAWWDAAEKQNSSAKNPFQKRAYKWYGLVVSDLSGLAKSRIETRLKVLDSLFYHGTINLLNLAEIKQNPIAGTWDLHNGVLVSDQTINARIEFMYKPPLEYDYQIIFARKDGNDTIGQLCAAMGHPFLLALGGWRNSAVGFEAVDGQYGNNNSSTRRSKSWFKIGQRYTSLIKVRRGGMQVFLDGKLLTELKTDYKNLELFKWWSLSQANTIGLGTDRSPTFFYSAQIIEITGHGEKLKFSAPGPVP